MPITPDISRKLLSLKEESGLTFKQIGDEVGSSEANVRRYIMGETKVPDRQLLSAIIRSIGGDTDEIFGRKKPEQLLPAAPPVQTPSFDHAMYARQEERHNEILAQWSQRHREEIANLKAAYDSSLQSKDVWIERVKAERDKAEGDIEVLENELAELRKDRRHYKIAIAVLSALVIFFILVYFIPDLLRGDWGHIVYSIAGWDLFNWSVCLGII